MTTASVEIGDGTGDDEKEEERGTTAEKKGLRYAVAPGSTKHSQRTRPEQQRQVPPSLQQHIIHPESTLTEQSSS